MTNCLNKKLVVVWSWEPSLIGKNLFNWKPENFGCWASQFLLGDMSFMKKKINCVVAGYIFCSLGDYKLLYVLLPLIEQAQW